uniref:hypothetical protein n=1 Tax=Spiroplasma helicoides TaxID=216938 RepID=UPI0018DD8A4A
MLSLLAATGLVASSSSVAVAFNKKANDTTSTTKKDLSTIVKDLKLWQGAGDKPTLAKV